MLSKFWTSITRHPFGKQPGLVAPTARRDDMAMVSSYRRKKSSEKLDCPAERSLSAEPEYGKKVLTMSAHATARSRLGVKAKYEESVRVYEQAWGPEHTLTLDAVNTLGLFYAGQCRTGNAEKLLKRTFEGREGVHGSEHPLTLDAANSLGRLYQKQGRLNDAEIMYGKALRGYTKVFGSEHIATVNMATSLADLYVAQGSLQHAERMFKRVLRSKQISLGSANVSTLDTVSNLGCLYASQGRLNEAEAMYVRALRGYEDVFGTEHTSTLEMLHNLGLVYHIQGQASDAEAMYMRALGGYEKMLGKSRIAIYPPAVNTLECLANLLYELNRIEESRRYLLCAEAGIDAVFGRLHQRYEKIFTTMSGSLKRSLSPD